MVLSIQGVAKGEMQRKSASSMVRAGKWSVFAEDDYQLPRKEIPCATLLLLRRFLSFMLDEFAILQQPRRPWLDPEALKERFHRLTAEHHPDVAGTEGEGDFASLNSAYSALREPASRLRRLLELEAPEKLKAPQQIPNAFADLFMKIARFRQGLDAFHQKSSAASSALARALISEERFEWADKGGAIRAELESAHEAAVADLVAADAAWHETPRPADLLDRLAGLQHRFAYLTKWRAQMTEALFQFESSDL